MSAGSASRSISTAHDLPAGAAASSSPATSASSAGRAASSAARRGAGRGTTCRERRRTRARSPGRCRTPCGGSLVAHAPSLPEPGSVAVHGHRPLERSVHRRDRRSVARLLGGRSRPRAPARWTTTTGLLRGVPAGADRVDQPVPEPKTVKNRVHLDLVRRSTALVALGGTSCARHERAETWIVVDDPDGAELCVFDSAQPGEPSALVVDSVDAGPGRWWADVLRRDRPGAGRGSALAARRVRAAVRRLEVRAGARAQDGQEPHALGPRVPDVDALVARGATAAAASRTTRSTGTCSPTPRATSSARSLRVGSGA